MRPQSRHMDIALFEAARSGDVQAFQSLPSARPADTDVHSSNYEATVVIHTEGDATQPAEESKNIIFGVTTVGGNTVLHIAAEHRYLDFAREVCSREPSLVDAVNTRLETPLHCCAREGHDQIVSLIIDTARSSCSDGGGAYNGLLDVLRARNVHGETALHEASRFGHDLVAKKLIEADNELASFVSDSGMSPLYLAVLRKSKSTVEALLHNDSTSFTGPGGQTALHAAVARCQDITRMILEWKPVLGRFVDESHSTPLHYVASDGDENMTRILVEHDPSTAYISDIKDGYFPIHVAACMGHVSVIDVLLEQCPDSFELVDYKGRSFLHVAAEKSLEVVVSYVSQRKYLEKMLNGRDNDGNTPLHLAASNKIPKGIVFELLKNRTTDTCAVNNEGRTQIDLQYKLLPAGMLYDVHSRWMAMSCLAESGAVFSPQRLDHARHEIDRGLDEEKETKKQISLSKNLAITSVLIATVTFAAGITMPGGYNIADGTSVLKDKFTFKAFLLSDTFAMVFSLSAALRINFFTGTSMVDDKIRMKNLYRDTVLLWYSFVCMCMAFSMATFAVVVPKAWLLGISLCIISLLTPIGMTIITGWPVLHLRRTVVARSGYKHWLVLSKVDSRTSSRQLLRPFISLWSMIYFTSEVLLIYFVVFMLALICR